jgi:hypothetical protein
MMNCFALALIIGGQQPADTTKDIESKLLSTLDQQFWDSSRSRWREMAGKDDEVFLWGYSVLFSTFAIGAKVDPATYKPRLERVFDGLSRYWTDKAPGGYAVLPGQSKNPDRYYDDNAWVGLAAMEAYSATKEVKYLDIAKKVMTYLRSGEDEKLGGGIYWHENKKESKNACVNGPAAMLAFKLFLVTHDDAFQADGERWFVWTSKLADKDLLIMDNMNLSGKIDRTKWSYNSACYMIAACLRGEIATRESPVIEVRPGILRVLQMSDASIERWLKSDHSLVDNPGMFAMHLFEALACASHSIDIIRNFGYPGKRGFSGSNQYITSIFEKCRNEQGLLGEYWNRKPLPGENLKLMYTASLLRTALLCRTK